MENRNFEIGCVPAIVWGSEARQLYLYIHGQGGNKEEAAILAEHVCSMGFQVLSVDLPEHGARKNEAGITFDPWHAVPELKRVMAYAKAHWDRISLFANSIGAWFSMLGLADEALDKCMLLSPVVDMRALVSKMMRWANVTEDQLRRDRIIPTDFGQTLSWDYWTYILEHSIEKWSFPTAILYGDKDHLVERESINRFVDRFKCNLTVMPGGEHWFHTEDQLRVEREWIECEIKRCDA